MFLLAPGHASLEPDGETLARVANSYGWSSRTEALNCVRSLLAGEAAECILTGRAPDWEGGSWSDHQKAKDILERLGYGEKERPEELRRLLEETMALLRENWSCVEHIAALLIMYRRVDGQIVDWIANTDGKDPVPPFLMKSAFGSQRGGPASNG